MASPDPPRECSHPEVENERHVRQTPFAGDLREREATVARRERRMQTRAMGWRQSGAQATTGRISRTSAPQWRIARTSNRTETTAGLVAAALRLMTRRPAGLSSASWAARRVQSHGAVDQRRDWTLCPSPAAPFAPSVYIGRVWATGMRVSVCQPGGSESRITSLRAVSCSRLRATLARQAPAPQCPARGRPPPTGAHGAPVTRRTHRASVPAAARRALRPA